MAERTLNNPLTGEEIVVAVLSRIGDTLRRDCYLNPTTAYRWYEADFSFKIVAEDAPGPAVIERVMHLGAGKPSDPTATHFGKEIQVHIDPAPPNEVRQQSGQGIPTLTKDEKGRPVEKNVQYAKRQPVGATK